MGLYEGHLWLDIHIKSAVCGTYQNLHQSCNSVQFNVANGVNLTVDVVDDGVMQ
jgi:exo-beta-1,3-glucanase (GH17 family)